MKKIIPLVLLILISCKKESDPKYNWQIVDSEANELQIEYNKTETEIKAKHSNVCSYYRTDESKFCWYLSNGIYVTNRSEKFVNCWFSSLSPIKINCSTVPYCEKWYTRKKYVYKPTGQYTVSGVRLKNYCTQDTIQLLNNTTIQIVLTNTTDSLILLERSKTGNDFY